MLNAFCQGCAGKPGWPFKQELVVLRSCMRCCLHRPCNFYVDQQPVSEETAMKAHKPVSPAPKPKDLVTNQVNSQAECKLPKVAGHKEPEAPKAAAAAAAAPPDGTEADSALSALEATRAASDRGKGVQLETKVKGK